MLTRGGIAYDLNTSPFHSVVCYGDLTLTFTFSGQYNLNAFESRLQENRDKINGSLTNRFKIDINCDILCDIKLYSTIEKRGFLVEGNEDRFECLNNIKLDGLKLTIRN